MLEFLARLLSQRRKPVGKALAVEAGVLETRIAAAIAAIDRVHTDGVLPRIPIKQAVLFDMYGYFLEIGGTATEIGVSVMNPHVELTTVHEIGHFLDFKGLDGAAGFASVNSPKLDAWRQAIRNSHAAQNLRQYLSPALSTVKETLPDGSVVEYAIDKKYVDYLLKAEELWARSYSQFISMKSRDAELISQLDRERDRPVSGIHYEKLWGDADFQPIMLEIEVLFKQLRWM